MKHTKDKKEEIVSGTIGTTITAINPNDYSVIKRDDFIRQYGKAAERLLREERQQLIDEVVENLSKKEDNSNLSIGQDGFVKGYNKSIDDITKLLVEMKEI